MNSSGLVPGAIPELTFDFKALIRVWLSEPKQKSLGQYTKPLPRVHGNSILLNFLS